MRAKITKTEEYVDVYHEPQHGQTTLIYKEARLVNARTFQESELEFINEEENLEREIGMFTTQNLLRKRNHSTGIFHLTQKDIDNIARHFHEMGRNECLTVKDTLSQHDPHS